jgi:hypothetical protein
LLKLTRLIDFESTMDGDCIGSRCSGPAPRPIPH